MKSNAYNILSVFLFQVGCLKRWKSMDDANTRIEKTSLSRQEGR